MKKILTIILFFLVCCYSNIYADHLSGSLQITARMNGANEVPAVITDAQGIGIFTISLDKKSIAVDVSVSGLSGDITGIHIHEGMAGTNGAVVFNLSDFVNGNRISTTMKDISSDQMEKFLNGTYYLNVHTDENPGGEIRAQLILESDFRYMASLNGMQEVPAVTTDAYGLGVFNLSKSGYKLEIKAVVQGLSGDITGAHLHSAATGVVGDVVQNLTMNVVGNVITATVDPSAYLTELLAGDIYLNIHTAANPGGEIRGQLSLSNQLYFDSFLDGNQEVPAVTTLAEGVAAISISNTMDAIEYDIVVDGLSGDITGAHFHIGAAGTAGGVVLNLTDDIDGNRITGSINGLSVELINQFLSGGIYLNIHTDANPGGEIRGQVYKLAREAYTYQFSGGQEVPATNSPGTGAGMVSIDRDQTNAHFMMVVSGLNESIDAAHFHNAKPGVVGDVIYNLTPFLNATGGAYGYWTEEDSPSFMQSLLFRNNEVYVNIHTATFPGGAIRANIIRSRDLFTALPTDPEFGAKLLMAARLSGAAEVPAVTTDAVGVTSLMLNEDRTAIDLSVSVNNLTGPITGIHLHQGLPGTNGDVVFDLTPFLQGNRVTTTLIDFTSTQLNDMLNGEFYLNVHTDANPGGEIRGQIELETDPTYRANLTADQEVPGNPSTAIGLGTFNYTKVLNLLEVNVLINGLSGPITGIHLHNAAAGVNGDVVENLGPLLNGNQVTGSVDPTAYLAALQAGEIYINVHTDAYPGGEIRGQLTLDNNLTFDTWLNGAQEVPPAVNASLGLASVSISPDFTEINYRIIATQLSGAITGAHFHNAQLGEAGDVVLNLSDNINGNEIMGTASGMDVTDELINQLLTGQIYLNLHSAGFPGGEMRGQLFRLARDGYGYDICTNQETSVVDVPTATGAGMASIDRNRSNAHVMIVASGLSGDISGAHIHEGITGVDGPVIYNLTDKFSNGGMFTYWGANDPDVEFTTAIAEIMQAERTYVNIHTNLNPGGEIRGQIVKVLDCFFTTSVQEIDPGALNIAKAFPNPASNELNIQFTSNSDEETEVSLISVTGQQIYASSIQVISNQPNNHQIALDQVSPGIYYLFLKNKNYLASEKIVVIR